MSADDAPEAERAVVDDDGGTDADLEVTEAAGPAVDAETEAVLEVEDVDSGYGDMQVLYDMSMHLYEEEIVCMVGPNGAGKSTVLKTVFGLLEPWNGSVRLHGEEIGGEAPEEIVRRGMAYVPQVENVFGPLTVHENLKMGGVAREDPEDVIEDLYERFPLLADKRDAKASSLSGGQQQLLALARALVMEPDVLLIDEPSAGLAPTIVDDVFDDVRKVNELGTAILMIEQNARAGLRISDRGYVLDQGSVEFEGPADRLLEDPKVGELYLGG